MTVDDLIEIFYNILVAVADTLRLPTGWSLLCCLKISVVVCLSSAIGSFFHLYTFISWQGALIAVIVLCVLAYMERSGNNELSKMYLELKSSFRRLKR